MLLDKRHFPRSRILDILSNPLRYYNVPEKTLRDYLRQLKKARAVDLVVGYGNQIHFWMKTRVDAKVYPSLPIIYAYLEEGRQMELNEFIRRVYAYGNPWVALLVDSAWEAERVARYRLILEYLKRIRKYGCDRYVPVKRMVDASIELLAEYGVVEVDDSIVYLSSDVRVKPEDIVRWLVEEKPRRAGIVYSKYGLEGLAVLTWVAHPAYSSRPLVHPPRNWGVRYGRRIRLEP